MRFLLSCYPIPGHLNPNLALAHALRVRGHEVAMYSGSAAKKAIEDEAIQLYAFDPCMDRLATSILWPTEGPSAVSSLSSSTGGFLRKGELNRILKEWFLQTIPQQVADLERACADFQPDVLVTDLILMGPLLVLKDKLSIPVAVFSVLSACSVPGPDAPAWGRGLRPPRTLATRLRSTVERKVMNWLTADFRADANRIRHQYGLPALKGILADEYKRVPLFTVATVPSFDYNRKDLPESVQYVGACLWTGGKAMASPAWLTNLRRPPPVVHVTEGTIYSGETIVLKAAAAGLSGLPLHVIMTTGKHRKPEDLNLGPVGANVRIEQFVPHHALFTKTDVVVTTGGAGTVNTALLEAIPLIVVPTGWDLPENAQRVVECGAGLRISPRHCTPERLRKAVQTVLADPRYRENARRIGMELKNQGGPARAAELLERLVASKTDQSMSFTK